MINGMQPLTFQIDMSKMNGLATKLSEGREIEVYRCPDGKSISIRTYIDGARSARIRLSDEAMWAICEMFVRIKEDLLDDKQYDVRYQWRERVNENE